MRRTLGTALAGALVAATATLALAVPAAQASTYGGTYPTYQDCYNAGVAQARGQTFHCIGNGGGPQDPSSWSLYLD